MNRILSWLPDWDSEEWNRALGRTISVLAYLAGWVFFAVSVWLLMRYSSVTQIEQYPNSDLPAVLIGLCILALLFGGIGSLFEDRPIFSALVVYGVALVFCMLPYYAISQSNPIPAGWARVHLVDHQVYEAGEVPPRDIWKATTVPFKTIYAHEYEIPASHIFGNKGTLQIVAVAQINPQSSDFKERLRELLGNTKSLDAVRFASDLDATVKAHAVAIFTPAIKNDINAVVGQVLHSDAYAYIASVMVKKIKIETSYGEAP